MKKTLLILVLYLSVCISGFSYDSINGERSGIRIICSESHNKGSLHLVNPSVIYNPLSSTITIDFGNQPIEDYSVTISSPFTDVDYYITSSYTTIPLVVDGYSDYTIIIETSDGDVFEGTLAASDYTTTATF